MSRYIDLDLLLPQINERLMWWDEDYELGDLYADLMAAPHINIVFCQYCIYYNGHEEYCQLDHFARDDGYCYYGDKGDN